MSSNASRRHTDTLSDSGGAFRGGIEYSVGAGSNVNTAQRMAKRMS